jgi:hypothetical protein
MVIHDHTQTPGLDIWSPAIQIGVVTDHGPHPALGLSEGSRLGHVQQHDSPFCPVSGPPSCSFSRGDDVQMGLFYRKRRLNSRECTYIYSMQRLCEPAAVPHAF